MGFGILFIGYFLLLNFTFYAFSDAIAATVMLYALYKLSSVNRGFARAMCVSVAFVFTGIAELVIKAVDMFVSLPSITTINSVSAIVRYLLVALLTVFILYGIEDVAAEVKLHVQSDKARRARILTIIIYSLDLVLEFIGLLPFELKFLNYVAVLMIVLTLTVLIMNLTVIYSAYMRICLPKDVDLPERESRFAFVNAFRRHEEEKQKEYEEYKLEKQRKQREKKAQGKKK